MAKVTDLNEIRAFAAETIADFGSELLEFLTRDEAINCFTMIYVTNDQTTGFAQDYTDNISVLSSPTRIGIIWQGHHSYYKVGGRICLYDAIEDDMNEIRIAVDAALMRWEAQNDNG